MKALTTAIFCLFLSVASIAQQYRYTDSITVKEIDSLVEQQIVHDEFKILNYCFCIDYLNKEQENDKPLRYRKKIVIQDFDMLGLTNSYFEKESSQSFFAHQNPDSLDFRLLLRAYYQPIVKFLRAESDYHVLSDFSKMFECYYAVEHMPLKEELRRFLLLNRRNLKLLKKIYKADGERR